MSHALPDAVYTLALTKAKKVGPITARALIEHFGTAKAVFAATQKQLEAAQGINRAAISGLKQREALLSGAQAEWDFCQANGIQVHAILDDAFPHNLRNDAHLPLTLFTKGTLDLNSKPAIAIVGTRRPSDYGLAQTRRFAQAFAEAGINVVSGLAYGVDIEAHRTTLKAGGTTTAVLGHGLGQIYPQAHEATAQSIIEKGGLLVTEFWHAAKPDAKNFPARNRIIAGLCQAVLVMEAAAKGGALITGRMGFELNREVFALPGRVDMPSFDGCNRMIQDNVAKLVTSPEQVLEELSLDASKPAAPQLFNTPPPDLPKALLAAYNAIPQDGAHVDQLALKLNQPTGVLMAQLLDLEFRGLIRQLPGRRFVRA